MKRVSTDSNQFTISKELADASIADAIAWIVTKGINNVVLHCTGLGSIYDLPAILVLQELRRIQSYGHSANCRMRLHQTGDTLWITPKEAAQ